MVSNMKTTFEIAEPLLVEAKRVAARRKTTLRALIEEGLRRVIEEQGRDDPFHLRSVSFKGEGLAPEFVEGGWERIRDAAYEGHGA